MNLMSVTVDSMMTYTLNDARLRPMHKSVTGFTDLTFKVKADSRAVVSLLGIPGNTWLAPYTLTIGEGDMTKLHVLNKTTSIIIEEHTLNILSANEFRPFWISWQAGSIQFGKGETPGNDRVLQYSDPQRPYVHSVSFASAGNVWGLWQMGNVEIGKY